MLPSSNPRDIELGPLARDRQQSSASDCTQNTEDRKSASRNTRDAVRTPLLPAEHEPVPLPEFRCNKQCLKDWGARALHRFRPSFPLMSWLPIGDNKGWHGQGWRNTLLGDMFGGLTAGFLLIPQGMAYALIVGLPPEYGLYAGFLPTVVYSFFGSSGQASIGPVALVGVLAEEGISHAVGDFGDHPERYVNAAALLAFQCGIIQILFGALGVGFLATLLSHPVIEGFTLGGALIIFSKQVGSVLGIQASAGSFFGTIGKIFENIGDSKWETVLYSFSTIIVLLAYKRYKQSDLPFSKTKQAKLFPIILVTLLLTILISYLAPSDNVAILGAIPEGLPTFVLPDVFSSDFGALLPTAFVISVIGFVESYSVSSKFAILLGYELDADKEFMGLGWANFLPSFFQSFPISASFGRTAIVADAGGRTPAQGLWTALVMLITLTLLTPIFKHIPLSVLGGVVMVAVSGLIKPRVLMHLWQTSKADFFAMFATTIFILVLGIDLGIGAGVATSFVIVVAQSLFPKIEQMGRRENDEGHHEYVAVNGNEKMELREIVGIGIFSIEGVLYFANIDRLRSTVCRYVCMYRQNPKKRIHGIVLDMARVAWVDQTAAHTLHILRAQLEEVDRNWPVHVRLVNLRPSIQCTIDKELFFPADDKLRVSHERHFSSIGDAVSALLSAHDSDCSSRAPSSRRTSSSDSLPSISLACDDNDELSKDEPPIPLESSDILSRAGHTPPGQEQENGEDLKDVTIDVKAKSKQELELGVPSGRTPPGQELEGVEDLKDVTIDVGIERDDSTNSQSGRAPSACDAATESSRSIPCAENSGSLAPGDDTPYE